MSLSRSVFAILSVAASAAGCAVSGEEPDESLSTIVEWLSHTYTAPAKPTRAYSAPASNAIYVAPTGSDAAGDGSQAKPYKTIAKGVAIANAKPAGATWTVVLRAGTYREGGIVITRDDVAIQRYGTEAVAILGSQALTSFAGTGPYTLAITSFDPTPLEAVCADDALDVGAAKHVGADQAFAVFRGGVPLQRVAVGATLATGQYTYDAATNKLTIFDSPTNIEATEKLWAFQTRKSRVRLAGLDIEGYGTCAVNYRKTVNGIDYYAGAVQFFKDAASVQGGVIEGSTIANNAAAGVQLANGHGITLDGNTLSNNGWDGVVGSAVDGLVATANRFSFNNVRRWGNSVEAGMKLTHTQNGVIWGNLFEHNAANGFWCDQGCGTTDLASYFVVAQNVFRYNDGKGVFYEVSHHAMIASNLAHDNGGPGIAAYGARGVQIWNNTLVDNDATGLSYLANLSLVDDSRCAEGDTLPGGKACIAANGVVPLARTQYDHCAPSSDGALANTCNNEGIVVMNNIVSGSASARPLVNVTIPAKTYAAALAVTQSDYQAYWRSSTTTPKAVIEWQKDAGTVASYASLTAFRTAIAERETSSIERAGGTVPFFVDPAAKNFHQATSNTDVWGRGATLPSEVLRAVYWPATSPAQPAKRIGAIAWVE